MQGQGNGAVFTAPKGSTTIRVAATPGRWTITVEAYYKGVLYAAGTDTVIIHPNQTNEVNLMMNSNGNAIFTVYNHDTWVYALNKIAASGDNKNYIIDVVADFETSKTGSAFGWVTGINVVITGDKTISLASSARGNLLAIGIDHNIILHDVNLKGHYNNNVVLVNVSYGSLTMSGTASISESNGAVFGFMGTIIMKDNSSIHNNTCLGSIIHLWDSNTFIMQDEASIYNNESIEWGPVVHVQENNKFIMKGNSKIYDNTLNWGAAGVCVELNSSFFMEDNASVNNCIGSIQGGVVLSESTFVMNGNASVHSNVNVGVNIDSGSFTMNNSSTVYGNNGTGVGLGDGSFTMNDSSSIYGNNGGVEIISGLFTMNNSSTVYGNNGTGVGLGDGSFTMNDSSSIYGNDANGVGIGSGLFTMNGGTIYGDIGAPNGNTGGALVSYDTAKYGDGTDILPHTDGQDYYTNDTIYGRQ